MRELEALFAAQSDTTDKALHGYPAVYEDLFAPLRDSARNVVEIGIGHGGSIRAWRAYFPKAMIWTLDIEQRLVDEVKDLEGVRARCLDAGDRHQIGPWAGNLPPLDLVIDDGSHRVADILTTWSALWPRVREGGLYVIEDVGQVDDHFLLSIWLDGVQRMLNRISVERLHWNLLVLRCEVPRWKW